MVLLVANTGFFAPDDPLFGVIAVLLGSLMKRPNKGPKG